MLANVTIGFWITASLWYLHILFSKILAVENHFCDFRSITLSDYKELLSVLRNRLVFPLMMMIDDL